MERVPGHFSGSTQLVGMALEDVHVQHALFALPPEPGLPDLFGQAFPGACFLYHDCAAYRRDEASGTASRAEAPTLVLAARCDEALGPHDLVVVFLPKSKAETAMVLASVAHVAAPDARVMVVGPKKSGIRSSRPLIEQYIGPVGSSRSARHCVLIEARHTATPQPFEGTKTYVAPAFGHDVHVVTLPGVFSYGKLDTGTGFLLEHLDPARPDTVLDWGCGAGVIGTAIALACPHARVDLVDSHVQAIASTRLTLEANGLPTDRVAASDVFDDVHGAYDLIVSNPPFHAGLSADFSVAERFLSGAGAHLTRRGRLVFVANTFIKYAPHLRRCFRRVRVLVEDERFRVVEAGNPIRV